MGKRFATPDALVAAPVPVPVAVPVPVPTVVVGLYLVGNILSPLAYGFVAGTGGLYPEAIPVVSAFTAAKSAALAAVSVAATPVTGV